MTKSLAMRQLPQEERPRERLRSRGGEALSTGELLAVLLGSGMKGKSVLLLAQELLAHFGNLHALMDSSLEELCQIKGLGMAKAMQLTAAFHLSKRMSRERLPKYPVHHSQQAYQLVKEGLEGQKQECFATILQDVRGCSLSYEVISIGTLNNALVHPREVFYTAIRHKAASLILVHNHPSGDPTPSPQDYRLTQSLISAGKLLGIPVKDHLIIGAGCYHSMREEGLSFDEA